MAETVVDAAPGVASRLMAGAPGADFDAHLRVWGPLPERTDGVLSELSASGLRGRGGAGFPFARKLAAVAQFGTGQRRLVVGNGTEGEPLSAKDRILAERAPHLMLDGVMTAALLVGSAEGVVCVDSQFAAARSALEHAIAERGSGPVSLRVVAAPHRYLTGQETALSDWLAGGDGRPTESPPRPTDRGVLVSNVETLAHVALIARFGAAWFRTLGMPDDPGTTLVTLRGAVARPGVYEVAVGTRVADLLAWAGAARGAVLLGGYAGRWLSSGAGLVAGTGLVAATGLARGEPEASIGTGGGPAAVTVLDEGSCALAESTRVVRWLASQSAGQCGPCANGLPAIASAYEAVNNGEPTGNALRYLLRWCAMVERRGACGLPDGTVRFVRSCVQVLAAEIDEHRRRGPCAPTGALPTPAMEPWS